MTECAYCGGAATTDDHIPPQSVLPGVPKRSRPHVPSCISCNNGASDDDEYFRDVVLKYHRVTDRPEAEPAVSAMVRAMAHPKKVRYAKAVLGSIFDVDVSTPAGVYLGKQPVFRLDRERLERAIRRYIRGLHLLARGTRVPSDHTVGVRANPEALLDRQDDLAKLFSSGELVVIKDGVFWYKWVVPTDRPSASGWLLVLFDAFPILATVRPFLTPFTWPVDSFAMLGDPNHDPLPPR